MKNIVIVLIFCVSFIGFSQEEKATYVSEGDLVKATYFYADGSIKTQGFFKNKKLTGEWTRFDKEGNKLQLAYYNDGKKVGKWFIWSKDELKEINYEDNAVASIYVWKQESKVALSQE